ncbi:hypothetical protein D3C75_950380 [compost metagenome]
MKVVAVGADGTEGEAATLDFDLTTAVSGITTRLQDDGNFTVEWTNSGTASGDVTVDIKSVNWTTTTEPIAQQQIVPATSNIAVFANMPVNGDDYIVTISKGTELPVTVSGRFLDQIVEPYAEAWSWEGDRLNLPMPNAKDWRYMYVYEDGIQKSFPVTYFSGSAANRDRIIRGRTTKASLSFTTKAKLVYVIMEDYAGNRSERVYLRGHE